MRALFLFLFLFSFGASATDYSWRITYDSSHIYNASSPMGTFVLYHQAMWPGWVYEITATTLISPTSVKYTFRNKSSAGSSSWTNSGLTVTTNRLGDSCTAPATYDSVSMSCVVSSDSDGVLCNNTSYSDAQPYVWSSGSCVQLYRAPAAVMCKAFSKRDGGSTGSSQISVHFDTAVKGPVDGQTVALPNIGCGISVSTSKCTVNADGKSSDCLVTGTYTGALANSGNDPSAQDCHALGGCSAPDLTPKKNETNNPCVYAGSAGNLSCTSSVKDETTGSQNCGTFNGTYGCSWSAPTSKGIDIATNIVTTTNSDGTSTAVKTDTSTKTVCSDMNVCVVSVTKTVTTTTKDGQGNVTSAKSTCSGAACGTGSGTNGTGTGSGGTGTAESGTCVTAEECGDGSAPGTPKLDDVDDYQTTTQKFYDSVKGSPIANAVGSISAPESGTAPNLTTAPLPSLGGKSLDFGIIRDLKGTVDDVMQPTMKAFWCFVAVMVFLLA